MNFLKIPTNYNFIRVNHIRLCSYYQKIGEEKFEDIDAKVRSYFQSFFGKKVNFS